MLPEEAASQRWIANIRISGFTVMMLGIVVLAIIVLAPSLKLLIEQRAQIASLERDVAQRQAQVKHLQGEVARWDDPAYIEAQARERLLFVYPGEYSYIVVDTGQKKTTKDGAPISTSIQTTQVDWVKSMLSSVLTAGLSDKSAATLQSPVSGSQ